MKQYQLNIDPRILELLGPNLYTNIYYVLAELIANAYDADANNVYIISNMDDIRVEDDGHGMSYKNGDIERYLNVAGVSRSGEPDSFTRSGNRRKMGRKGVGKLAALSVSENVDILTIADGELSGFILSRRPEKDNLLTPIPESDIHFEKVTTHGSAVVMRDPQYRLHKTSSVVKKNILRLFPLVSSDFRIHIIRGSDTEVVDEFDKHKMSELSTLITLGESFAELGKKVDVFFPERRSDLVESRNEKSILLPMQNIDGKIREYNLKIAGWIGTYTTSRGRKLEISDFPDNFISLFANKKLGEFNILPSVGQNKLNEVYVVGQLHIDLFELTELPDMALSNRQGYKSDDPRYTEALKYIREELLPDILKKRELFTDLTKAKKKIEKQEKLRAEEEKLKILIDEFRMRVSKEAAINLFNLGTAGTADEIQEIIQRSLNSHSPDLGIKAKIDSQKKRILVSQTMSDKCLADIVYKMLLFNNVPPEDILYTNCDDEICRVPEGKHVYNYLRKFFVESYSTQKIYVLFITSENTKMSWGAITEVGASWITQVDHKIFNIHPFRPEHPLNDELQWQTTHRSDTAPNDVWMIPLNADIFCQKIEAVCDAVGYKKRDRGSNLIYLKTLVAVRDH